MKRLLHGLLIPICISQLGYSQAKFWNQLLTAPVLSNTDRFTCMENSILNEIYVGTTSSGLYKSSDNGITWTNILPISNNPIVKIKTYSLNKIVIATPHKVYRSNDSGNTWLVSVPGNVYSISDIEILTNTSIVITTSEVIEMPNNYTDYLGDGVLVSNDDGITWTTRNVGLNNTLAVTNFEKDSQNNWYVALSSYYGNGSGIYYSSDNGNQWHYITNQSFVSNDTIDITSFYEIPEMKVNTFDSIYFSFTGVSGNFSIMGNLKNNLQGFINSQPSIEETVYYSSVPWYTLPFQTVYFSKNRNLKLISIEGTSSNNNSGIHFQFDDQNHYTKKNNGVIPLLGKYTKFYFTEYGASRFYAVQSNDDKIYYTDSLTASHTGIKEPFFIPSSTIYPSPIEISNGIFYIKGNTPDKIEILDIVGRRIAAYSLNNECDNLKEISTNNLIAGTYLLKLYYKDFIKTYKILAN